MGIRETPRLGAAAGGGYVVGGWIALCAMADVVILRDSSSSATTGAGAGWRMCDAQLVPWESCATTGWGWDFGDAVLIQDRAVAGDGDDLPGEEFAAVLDGGFGGEVSERI